MLLKALANFVMNRVGHHNFIRHIYVDGDSFDHQSLLDVVKLITSELYAMRRPAHLRR